jgi:hypothetical protein
MRWFDGWQWTDWVSIGGDAVRMPLTPPATGGGTLVTEPVLMTSPIAAGSFLVTTQAGHPLATAVDPDAQGRRLEVSDPSGRAVLKLRRTGLGSSATVSVRMSGDNVGAELGRFERSGRNVRVLTRGAMVATVGVPDPGQGPVGIVDLAGAGLARIQRRDGTWLTELAHPLGDPLHPLVALAALAIELMEHI